MQQFESHPNKESFLQDLNKTEEINKFSEKSQKLIPDMNNTETFELSETSSKKQCPDCAFVEDVLNLRRELRSWTRTTTTSYQLNMDLLNGNECAAKLRKCCRKLVNPSMEDTKPSWKDGTRMTITAVLSDDSLLQMDAARRRQLG